MTVAVSWTASTREQAAFWCQVNSAIMTRLMKADLAFQNHMEKSTHVGLKSSGLASYLCHLYVRSQSVAQYSQASDFLLVIYSNFHAKVYFTIILGAF